MLQQATPEDYVLATGKTTTVREFVELAFDAVGMEIEWSGHGVEEKGMTKVPDGLSLKFPQSSSGPPKTYPSSAIPAKPGENLAGLRKTPERNLCK